MFADEVTTKRALVGRGRPLPPEVAGAGAAPGATTTPTTTTGETTAAAAAAPHFSNSGELDPSDVRNAPFLWHRGDDFVKAGAAVPLVYRLATVVSFFFVVCFFFL